MGNFGNGKMIEEQVTKEEIREILKPCSAALSVIVAILEDDVHEKVALRVTGIKSSIDLVISKLKNQNLVD